MKCLVCNDTATFRLSPDMDINGVAACNKHKIDVQVAIYMMTDPDPRIRNFAEKKIQDWIGSKDDSTSS